MKTPKELPRVDLTLSEIPNGNAFMVMGVFQRKAKAAGWEKKDIDEVLEEARNGDYNHLLNTIMAYSTL